MANEKESPTQSEENQTIAEVIEPQEVKISPSKRDVEKIGRDGLFQLICRTSSKKEGWSKTTRAMTIRSGCLIQVSTTNNGNMAESLVYIPNVTIQKDDNGNNYIG